MSAFQFYKLHRTGMKHQAADALSRLKTKGEDSSLLDDEVTVPTIPREIFASAPRTAITNLEIIEEHRGPFIPFISYVCITAGIKTTISRK